MASASLPFPAAASRHPRPRGQSLQLCAGGGAPGSSVEKAGNLAQAVSPPGGGFCLVLQTADLCQRRMGAAVLRVFLARNFNRFKVGFVLRSPSGRTKTETRIYVQVVSFGGNPKKLQRSGKRRQLVKVHYQKLTALQTGSSALQEVWKPCYPPTGQRNWWIYLANTMGT